MLGIRSSCIIDWYPVNMNIIVPRIGALQIGPRNRTTSFSKMAVTVLIKLFVETISLNTTA
jgi:hypothetical protein